MDRDRGGFAWPRGGAWLHGVAHQYGLMDLWPPMSQMFRLNPSLDRDLMLNPCVCGGLSSQHRVWHAGCLHEE